MSTARFRRSRAITLVEMIMALLVVGVIGTFTGMMLVSNMHVAQRATAAAHTLDDVANTAVFLDADLAGASSVSTSTAACDGHTDAVFSTTGSQATSWAVRAGTLTRVDCSTGVSLPLAAGVVQVTATCIPVDADVCGRLVVHLGTLHGTWILSPSRGGA